MSGGANNPKILRGVIRNLLEFVYWQEKEGNIDGGIDIENTIQFCIKSGIDYPPKDVPFAQNHKE